MKTKPWILSLVGVAILIVGIGTGSFLASSSSPIEQAQGHQHDAEASTSWTCSMHPQIQQPNPGKCPICGMDLIPLTQNEANENPRSLTLSETAKALARIETSPVERKFPEMEIRLSGKMSYDETRLRAITARFPARIDRLFVNYTGIPVNKGEHLAEVYSPELLTAQSELLFSIKQNPQGIVAEAARRKLLLWDLLPEQIQAIEERGAAQDQLELRAPLGGIVVEKHIKEGDYVQTGQSLFKIADLSHLWLSLDAYESEITWLRYGQKVSFEVETYASELFEGRIVFIDPILNEKTRTVKVRVDVKNEDSRLKPGMLVNAIVYSKISDGGKVFSPEFAGKWICPMHPEIISDASESCTLCGMPLVAVEDLGYIANTEATAPLVVPTSAVLRTGKRAVVYVETPGTDSPTYEGREIKIGSRAGNEFIVIDGLTEGERVVTNGAFKLDSSLQIQAKPSMMTPEETPASTEQSLQTTSHTPDKTEDYSTLPEAFKTAINSLLAHYFTLQQALSKDELPPARQSADKILKAFHQLSTDPLSPALVSKLETIHEQLHPAAYAIAEAQDLNQARGIDFESLTKAVIQLIEQFGTGENQNIYLMHCPMALDNKGADWLQNDPELRNPYFGPMMLRCGATQNVFTAKDSK